MLSHERLSWLWRSNCKSFLFCSGHLSREFASSEWTLHDITLFAARCELELAFFFLSATTGQIGSVYERARDPASFRTQGRRRNLYSLFFFSARLAIAVSSAGTPSSCGTLAFHKFRIFVPALFFSRSLCFSRRLMIAWLLEIDSVVFFLF